MDDYTRKILISDSQFYAHAGYAATEGAKAARASQLKGLHPKRKSDDKNDLLTEGDEAAQKAIIAALLLARTDEPIGILAEEKDAPVFPKNARWRWVIDPIDGTLPYSRGEPYWCVSVALQERMETNVWHSRIGVIYQASPKDTGEKPQGRIFAATQGKGAFMHLNSPNALPITRPDIIAPNAEFNAAGDFGLWGAEELTKRGIATHFRRSICYAICELLAGEKCAVVQDAGPMEWDIAAAALIAREAGVHVYIVHTDCILGVNRYALVMAWDKALFDLFAARLTPLPRAADIKAPQSDFLNLRN